VGGFFIGPVASTGRHRRTEECNITNTTTGTRALNNEWCLKIARQLRHGPKGFNVLQRAIGAANPPALSTRLKAMIRDGLVTREVISLGPPASTRYTLTALGRQLAEPATALIDWIDTHVDEVEVSRAKYRVASSS
jgi:DNA-binding HxlR family transcriptional regulator